MPVFGAWSIAVIRVEGGLPVIAQADPPYTNWVSMGDLPGNFGLFMVSDTLPRLAAADNLPGVYGICAMTKSGDVQWAELDNVITPAMRTKINAWLAAHGYPTIPAAWTNRRVVTEILKRINDKFDLSGSWKAEKE
jgi:hypothetical protein